MTRAPPAHSKIPGIVCGAVLLAAAAAKIADPDAFRATLLYLAGDREALAATFGVIAIGSELVTGLVLVAAPLSRVVAVGGLGLLIVYTAVVIRLVIDPAAPACACTGEKFLVKEAQTANWIALGRNVLLLLLAAWNLRSASGSSAARHSMPLPAQEAGGSHWI